MNRLPDIVRPIDIAKRFDLSVGIVYNRLKKSNIPSELLEKPYRWTRKEIEPHLYIFQTIDRRGRSSHVAAQRMKNDTFTDQENWNV